jgi:2-oxoisovalerate dehydrogenase E1 component
MAKQFKGFNKDQLLSIFRTMGLSRRADEKMLTLLRQGKSFFHIGAAGHEGAQIACAMNLSPGFDWAYPYYRDQTLAMGLGMTMEDIFLGFLAKRDDPGSGGRQLPQHYGKKSQRIVSQSSPTGTQFLQAVGTAIAARKAGDGSIVYVSSGEGTTSQGEFHEALNWASREKLPVLFHIEDNGYAISVPKASQMSDGSVYDMVGGYGNLHRYETDGTDFFTAYQTFGEAVASIRRGDGPAVVVSNVVRLMPHSSSDDHRKYREADELAEDQKRDPIEKFRKLCQDDGIITSDEFNAVWDEILHEIEDTADQAILAPFPERSQATTHVLDEAPNELDYSVPENAGDEIVIVDAINHALHEEMDRNENIILYGQDVADGKGGVFTATKGLSTAFGKTRVFNSPLAEASIVGTAVGASVAGLRPVVEIQFGDYIWTAMMQIRNEVATMRYRSNNEWTCPMVIRTPVGGYIHGGLCHSQSIEGFFMHLPGIHIVYPSNAADAKGLLKTACRINDPVLFLEHKGIYRQGFAKRPEPDENYLIPFGKAAVVREGQDLTIITYGMMVYKSIEAAKILEQEQGLRIEIIDLRTLSPLDKTAIGQSLQKTSKALVVYEDTLTAGPGAEIAAIIAEDFFNLLDGPVLRVGAKDSPVPFNWDLEDEVLPQTEDIRKAAERLLAY